MANNQIEKLFGSDSVGLATTESPGIASFSPADFLVTATGMVQSLTKWGIAYVLQALDNGYYSITSAFGTQATELGGPAKQGDVGLVLSGNKDKIGSIVKIISVASQVEPRQYTGDILGSIQGNTGDNGVVYICTDSNPLTLMPTVGMSRSVTESSILPEGYSVGDMVLWLVGYNGNTYLTIWQFDTLESMTCIVVSAGLKGLTGDRGVQGPQGPVGPKGDTGDQGIQGPIGPQGPVGDTGPTGPQGPQGNSGAQGPIGPQGIQGPEGPAGPAGIANINSRGNYEAGLTYYKNDVVYWSGLGAEAGSYICSVVSTTGSPASSPSDWGFFVAQGPRGLQGPQGPQGIEGPEGPQGPQGEVGEAGPAGSQGPQGAVGPQGPQGEEGQAGKQGAIHAIGLASSVTSTELELSLSYATEMDVGDEYVVLMTTDNHSTSGPGVEVKKGDVVVGTITSAYWGGPYVTISNWRTLCNISGADGLDGTLETVTISFSTSGGTLGASYLNILNAKPNAIVKGNSTQTSRLHYRMNQGTAAEWASISASGASYVLSINLTTGVYTYNYTPVRLYKHNLSFLSTVGGNSYMVYISLFNRTATAYTIDTVFAALTTAFPNSYIPEATGRIIAQGADKGSLVSVHTLSSSISALFIFEGESSWISRSFTKNGTTFTDTVTDW